MQLPLAVCQQFGQFAFQDEQKGVEAIAAFQDFIEEYQDVSISSPESQARVGVGIIERNEAGVVIAGKNRNVLPNLVFNIKKLVTEPERLLGKPIEAVAIAGNLNLDDWLSNVVVALRFIQFAIDLTTVDFTPEQARVLFALHHLSRDGELNLEIPLSELQTKIRDNYDSNLSAEELDDTLEDLVDLHCVSRQQDVIYLTEKIILKDD